MTERNPFSLCLASCLSGMEEHEVHGLKVSLYNFEQPARLSELQLPFKLLLLRQAEGHQTGPAPA